jgi:hypothetical protein
VELGKRLWSLWHLRPWLIVSFLLAVFVAVWSVARISLLPPKLTPRSLEMATATTHVVVDTPKSSVLDLRQNTYDFQALTQRAVLLGNVIANGPVRAAIAARAHVPVDSLQIAPPLTPKQPQATLGTGVPAPSVSDIAKSTDQYRLSIQADPTVPVLDIYAQAPSAATAAALANGAVDGLRQYLTGLAAAQQTPPKDQVQLLQLGVAHGTVINNGIEWQVAVLAFVLTFVIACAASIFLSRVGRGWRMAALAEQRAGG